MAQLKDNLKHNPNARLSLKLDKKSDVTKLKHNKNVRQTVKFDQSAEIQRLMDDIEENNELSNKNKDHHDVITNHIKLHKERINNYIMFLYNTVDDIRYLNKLKDSFLQQKYELEDEIIRDNKKQKIIKEILKFAIRPPEPRYKQLNIKLEQLRLKTKQKQERRNKSQI